MTPDACTLLVAVKRDLGKPTTWGAPVEFRDSLALAALNSAYSLRAKSPAVRNVLARYRDVRPKADTDGGPELMAAMDAVGGPERFAVEVLRNESKLPGTKRLRTVGLYEGLTKLCQLEPSVCTAADLRANAQTSTTKEAWRSVSGFGDMAWSYLLMNAGVTDLSKPDVMVQRYLNRCLEHSGSQRLSSTQVRGLLEEVAEELCVDVRSLDRAIWLYESPTG
ncbi:hypothetical protein [Demetria terragena]|uniref:hypothetical protein n=1 Tax=Demetria terragena TaxID=63959 RepID=UPI000376A749|nr:hypothetical protein [Demetria terragena]